LPVGDPHHVALPPVTLKIVELELELALLGWLGGDEGR
jgi:hypothetical protein